MSHERLPDAETPAPARFLPKWDNVLLAWADRTRVLPEQHRKTVIKVNGDIAQTFLVDGFVAGIWGVDDGRVVLEPFEHFSRGAARDRGRGRASRGVPRRDLAALGEQPLHARDLDPPAALDVMRGATLRIVRGNHATFTPSPGRRPGSDA